MKVSTLAIDLLALRRAAGLNQGQLAARMGTAQPAIARAEAGRVMPSVKFIERWARACGTPYTLVLGGEQPAPTAEERQAIVRSIFGADNWNPYDRAPSAVERRTLRQQELQGPGVGL